MVLLLLLRTRCCLTVTRQSLLRLLLLLLILIQFVESFVLLLVLYHGRLCGTEQPALVTDQGLHVLLPPSVAAVLLTLGPLRPARELTAVLIGQQVLRRQQIGCFDVTQFAVDVFVLQEVALLLEEGVAVLALLQRRRRLVARDDQGRRFGGGGGRGRQRRRRCRHHQLRLIGRRRLGDDWGRERHASLDQLTLGLTLTG